MRAFKAHLWGLAPYPYKKVEAPVKLDQNESPFDLPPSLKEEALRRLARLPWNRYPEIHAEGLRRRLAHLLDWPEEGIVLAPGSNLLILALAVAAEEVLDLVPSFPHYAHAARVAGTPRRAVPLLEGFALPLEALLAAFTGGVLFLPNPHAPTGALFPEEALEALAERAREVGGLLVVDEAYREFAGTDFRPLARQNPHVALLRTFSKAFALGGVRAGYLLASPEVAALVREVLPPFVLPAHTAAILEVVLENPGYVEAVAAHVRAERERVYAKLRGHPTWQPYRSHTNFLLVRTPDAERAFRHLLAQGILVRRQDHYPGLFGCIRVTVGSKEEMDAFLKAAFEVAYA
ncbi:pyridoxal phosphate-dependent aminotransferase [Thermus scotoductus]|uniref:Histidinol-phosphate aminotransferase n=1 Tax=Thermus scotoductus TaxID=37636 RepID=A0A430R1B6_THESC|nr:histidinol-phosphate transaminase [Thermus scotoductus]RTG93328.1 histidinol-phosphate aminotransferase [Thermus scotoductus]RTH01191.1 histidinol-phosphate aminotransferase [Thermus scotoductus]RTH17332.1 histidinol-phosphate aminotransferase [Thermus scotoductus]RTH97436.1 histidinol-phosphate aminotransferase [Thermus scotoductus]RTI18823.1 histidinol-phosphate aminotransferase [Thermus scotoductus]